MASIRVNSTSPTEARIVSVRSDTTDMWMFGGMLFWSDGSLAFTLSAVVMTLALACLNTSSRMARLPFVQAASSSFCGPSTARPISPMRIAAPLR
jgi:hypothetical protein